MTYEAVLAAIHSRKTFSSSASLERIARLMDRLGNPQNRYKTVHIAGTNGKGSVCAMTEAGLRAGGYRVGLFTSPYLVDFRERIQIDREMISQERLVECYQAVMAEEEALEAAGFEPVNEFELVTAIGFLAFWREHVEIAVIEVGLGGRCDATNVIKKPEICGITPISLDHTAVLGETVAEIAREKGGIIKPGVPVVLGSQEAAAKRVLAEIAEMQGSPIILAEKWEYIENTPDVRLLKLGQNRVFLPFLGRFQGENLAVAWEICKRLGIAEADIRRGIERASWPGRLQFIPGKPDLLIDAGHNPAGIAALGEALDEYFPGRKPVTVMAMMRDKDFHFCIPEIASRSGTLIAATVGLPRSLAPEELAAEAEQFCPTETAGSVAEGIRRAREIAEAGGLILVCGSVYAAGEAQKFI